MKGTVTDPELLALIRPLDLQLYLRAQGWKPVDSTVQSDAVDWEIHAGDAWVEVTAPRHARWRDYPRRVREMLAALSQLEGRSESAIARDIQRASRDIVRVRAVEYIKAAGRSMRERSPVDGSEVLGTVIAIDRPTGAPYQASDLFAGVATVLADVDGRPRKVRTHVVGGDWTKAHDAIGKGLLLSCRGELTREGTLFVLKNPRDIELIAPDDDRV
ncbi:MAG: hypothetical protein H7138_00665 [Myxococcales bacterium]|nr:hypothetical protein [Myxococcales bacterium]